MEALVRETIKQYYDMTDEQRAFILKVMETDPTWKKYDFMKALMLFNKSKEHACDLADNQLDEFVKMLDNNQSQLNYWLKKVDKEFRAKHGYME